MSAKLKSRPQARRGKGPRTDRLEIRLESNEKDGFQDAADIAGIPLSNWVRERLRWAATKELQEAGRDVPFLRHI